MSPNARAAGDSQTLREKLESRILKVIDEIDTGFKKVMMMYSVAFYTGWGLIIFSVVGKLYFKDNIFPLIFGGAGIIDVVAFFIVKPVEDLQRSRGNLAQLVSAFLTWYNDTHNWNQVVEKELRKPESDVTVFKEVSKRNVANTIAIMSAIELFVASRLSDGAGEKIKEFARELEEKIES